MRADRAPRGPGSSRPPLDAPRGAAAAQVLPRAEGAAAGGVAAARAATMSRAWTDSPRRLAARLHGRGGPGAAVARLPVAVARDRARQDRDVLLRRVQDESVGARAHPRRSPAGGVHRAGPGRRTRRRDADRLRRGAGDPRRRELAGALAPAALACRWLKEDAFAVVPEQGVLTPSWYVAGRFVDGARSADEAAVLPRAGGESSGPTGAASLAARCTASARGAGAADPSARGSGKSSYRDDRW